MEKLETFAPKSLKKSPLRSQSAMEYLMTYGWAILILAVILGAFYQLGVFNSNSFATRALPGSCQVVRPGGQYTTTFISLEGECLNNLPKYTAFFDYGTVVVPAAEMPSGTAPRTIIAWINPNSEGGNTGIFYYGGTNCNPDGAVFGLIISSGNLFLWGSCDDVSSSVQIPLNTWSFVAVNYTGSTASMFYNGKLADGPFSYSSDACDSSVCSNAYIGGYSGWWGGQYSGEIANLQIYNSSLSANEIQALYQEGIGGAPIDLKHLVGWWPLNGNTNDTSGNGNNGVPYGIEFKSS